MELVYNSYHWKVAEAAGDTKFCTVVALANTMDSDYTTCYRYIQKVGGRIKGRGLSHLGVENIFKNMQSTVYVKGPYSRQDSITLNQFCKKHPKGRYYILVRGHALAIIDGDVYDHKLASRRRIIGAWRVYLEEEKL
jgi:hypothetical protein